MECHLKKENLEKNNNNKKKLLEIKNIIAKMKILIKWLIDKIEEIFQKIWENEKKCLADRKAKIIFLNQTLRPNNRSSRKFRKNQPTNQRSHHILQVNFPELKYVSDWKESSKYSAQLMRIVSL